MSDEMSIAEKILSVGFNETCMFCGFKDKIAKEAMEAKPLRWRTGPVPETDKWEEFLVCSPLSATGYGYSIRKGNLIDAGEKYIPLSDILGLVEG